MSSTPRTAFPLAASLFFLSGALGLGYELIWIRKAALVVGASQIAMSTVLTAFFLGLGLGSLFVGRSRRAQRRSPLFTYGLFEIAIGVFALAFPWLFTVLEAIYGAAYPIVGQSAPALFALRFLLLFSLCLVPTFFMGGTLPLLLDGLVRQDAAVGARTSMLYGINILGAVVGVLLTAYWAIPHLGMNGTSMAGGLGNLAIGLVALLAFGRGRVGAEHEEPGPGATRLFRNLAFASGLVAIAYQIAWARYFSLFHEFTVFITAMLLAVYLLALAVGSMALAPMLRRRFSPMTILATVWGVLPLASLFGLEGWRAADYRVALYRGTYEVNPDHDRYWQFWSESADATFFLPLFQIALTIFIPVVLLGVALPAVIAAATERASDLRRTAGQLVFWNTLGSSLGGFLAGYAFLPALGLHRTLLGLGAASVALAVVALRTQPNRRWVPQGAIAVGALAVVAFAITREDVTRHTIRNYGYGREGVAANMDLVEVEEGPFTSSFVFESDDSVQMGSGHVCLAVAYKNTFSTQAFQGHIPALFYPNGEQPRDALGICLGSGQSFGALLLHGIETVDVVDISSEIKELSLRHFAPFNHGLGEDPRVRFHLDDGRHFVERAPAASYDVISMEPPPPTADGVYSLYSVEFYEQIARVLRPGGVFMQWLPLYRITPLDTKGIIASQAAVFPHTFVVRVGADDFMVLSYPRSPRFDLAQLERRAAILDLEWQRKKWDRHRWAPRAQHDMSSPTGVLALLTTGPSDMPVVAANAMEYFDDTQKLGYDSGDRWLLRRYEGNELAKLSFTALPLTSFEKLAQYFDPPLQAAEIRTLNEERARSLELYGVPDPATLEQMQIAFQAATTGDERFAPAFQLALQWNAALDKDRAFDWLGRAIAARPQHDGPRAQQAAQQFVRHWLAVFPEVTREHVARLRQDHPGAPLVTVLERELASYDQRQAAFSDGFLFPGSNSRP